MWHQHPHVKSKDIVKLENGWHLSIKQNYHRQSTETEQQLQTAIPSYDHEIFQTTCTDNPTIENLRTKYMENELFNNMSL